MKNPFSIYKPYAATMEEWDSWHDQMKQQYPIRYFMSESMPMFFRVHFKARIEHFFYWLRSHLIPSRRYHMLDLRQPDNGFYEQYRWGWIDRDHALLYANMNLLCEFVEKEHGGPANFQERIDWLREEKCPFEKEQDLLDVYSWWRKGRIVEWTIMDNALTEWFKNRTQSNADQLLDSLRKLEEAFDAKDDEMLIKLVNARRIMWT